MIGMMMRRMVFVFVVMVSFCFGGIAYGDYEVTKGGIRFRLEVDFEKEPELRGLCDESMDIIVGWREKIGEVLKDHTDGTGKFVVIRFHDKGAPAFAVGHKISLSRAWFKRHPKDIGCVLHEYVHVMQAYKNGGHGGHGGWAVEGIADYVRYVHFAKRDLSWFPKGGSYRDGYNAAAGFLYWLEEHVRPGIVKELDGMLRVGTYRDDVFEALTGRDVDWLWTDYCKGVEYLTTDKFELSKVYFEGLWNKTAKIKHDNLLTMFMNWEDEAGDGAKEVRYFRGELIHICRDFRKQLNVALADTMIKEFCRAKVGDIVGRLEKKGGQWEFRFKVDEGYLRRPKLTFKLYVKGQKEAVFDGKFRIDKRGYGKVRVRIKGIEAGKKPRLKGRVELKWRGEVLVYEKDVKVG